MIRNRTRPGINQYVASEGDWKLTTMFRCLLPGIQLRSMDLPPSRTRATPVTVLATMSGCLQTTAARNDDVWIRRAWEPETPGRSMPLVRSMLCRNEMVYEARHTEVWVTSQNRAARVLGFGRLTKLRGRRLLESVPGSVIASGLPPSHPFQRVCDGAFPNLGCDT